MVPVALDGERGAHPSLGSFSLTLVSSSSSPLLPYLSLFVPSHSATDDDLKIQIENSGKKSLFSRVHATL